MITDEIIERCRDVLKRHYGRLFAGLVLLRPPFDYFQELHTIVDLLYPIQLESERRISAKPAPVDAYEQEQLALYRKAKREGFLVFGEGIISKKRFL